MPHREYQHNSVDTVITIQKDTRETRVRNYKKKLLAQPQAQFVPDNFRFKSCSRTAPMLKLQPT